MPSPPPIAMPSMQRDPRLLAERRDRVIEAVLLGEERTRPPRLPRGPLRGRRARRRRRRRPCASPRMTTSSPSAMQRGGSVADHRQRQRVQRALAPAEADAECSTADRVTPTSSLITKRTALSRAPHPTRVYFGGGLFRRPEAPLSSGLLLLVLLFLLFGLLLGLEPSRLPSSSCNRAARGHPRRLLLLLARPSAGLGSSPLGSSFAFGVATSTTLLSVLRTSASVSGSFAVSTIHSRPFRPRCGSRAGDGGERVAQLHVPAGAAAVHVDELLEVAEVLLVGERRDALGGVLQIDLRERPGIHELREQRTGRLLLLHRGERLRHRSDRRRARALEEVGVTARASHHRGGAVGARGDRLARGVLDRMRGALGVGDLEEDLGRSPRRGSRRPDRATRPARSTRRSSPVVVAP